MTKSAAFCVLRDARHLLPLLVGHYLRVGVDHILFIDDGSTDGSRDWLVELAGACKQVSVVCRDEPVFDQQAIMNEAAAELHARGYDLLLPFDADEFWMVNMPTLGRALAADGRPRAIHGRWINFVQSRTMAAAPSMFFDTIRYRVPDADGASRQQVETFERGFVSVRMSKVAVYGQRDAAFALGQHRLIDGPCDSWPVEFEIFHVPLRQRAEIDRRAFDFEPRRRSLRTGADRSWQSRFFANAVQAGQAERIWQANSADEQGMLALVGGRYPLISDPRFRLLALAAQRHVDSVLQRAA